MVMPVTKPAEAEGGVPGDGIEGQGRIVANRRRGIAHLGGLPVHPGAMQPPGKAKGEAIGAIIADQPVRQRHEFVAGIVTKIFRISVPSSSARR